LSFNVVHTVCIDDGEILDQVTGNGTWVAVVAQMHFDSERFHRRILKTLAGPLLVMRRNKSEAQRGQQKMAYQRSMQRTVRMLLNEAISAQQAASEAVSALVRTLPSTLTLTCLDPSSSFMPDQLVKISRTMEICPFA
jgi:hypothetical protein